MTAPEWAVEKAARALAWAEYIGRRVDAEVKRTGARWAGGVEDRIRKQERRRSFDAGWDAARAALDAVWPETTAEWGVKWPYRSRQPERVTAYRDRVAAEDAIKRQGRIYPCDGPGFLLRREVTPGEVTKWQEVDR